MGLCGSGKGGARGDDHYDWLNIDSVYKTLLLYFVVIFSSKQGLSLHIYGFLPVERCHITMVRCHLLGGQCLQLGRLWKETQSRSLRLEISNRNIWFGNYCVCDRSRTRTLGTVWRMVSYAYNLRSGLV